LEVKLTMGNGRKPGHLRLVPSLELTPPRTPGTLGFFDAAALYGPALPGDTPGTLGVNDWAMPHFTVDLNLHVAPMKPAVATPAADAASWDVDPDELLEEEGLNPEFVKAVKAGFDEARLASLRPRPREVYRSPERSKVLYAKYKAGGARAAGEWESVHNYGLGLDCYAHDEKGKVIDSDWSGKGWFKIFRKFEKIMKKQNLVSGEPFNDAGHFEYHPNWSGGAKGAHLKKVKKWAIDVATAAAPEKPAGTAAKAAAEPDIKDWMPYFWWAAGAGGTAPSAQILKKHPVPK
jgi:hypothetical protein